MWLAVQDVSRDWQYNMCQVTDKTVQGVSWLWWQYKVSYTVTALLKKLKQQSRDATEQRRPGLVQALQALGPFYLELKWEFHSWGMCMVCYSSALSWVLLYTILLLPCIKLAFFTSSPKKVYQFFNFWLGNAVVARASLCCYIKNRPEPPKYSCKMDCITVVELFYYVFQAWE